MTDGLPDSRVTSLGGAEDECLWVRTAGGLSKVCGAEVTPLAVFGGRDNWYGSASMHVDSDGTVWLATDDGIRRWTGEGLRTGAFDTLLPGISAHVIFRDSRQRLWLGTDRGAVEAFGTARRMVPSR